MFYLFFFLSANYPSHLPPQKSSRCRCQLHLPFRQTSPWAPGSVLPLAPYCIALADYRCHPCAVTPSNSSATSGIKFFSSLPCAHRLTLVNRCSNCLLIFFCNMSFFGPPATANYLTSARNAHTIKPVELRHRCLAYRPANAVQCPTMGEIFFFFNMIFFPSQSVKNFQGVSLFLLTVTRARRISFRGLYTAPKSSFICAKYSLRNFFLHFLFFFGNILSNFCQY